MAEETIVDVLTGAVTVNPDWVMENPGPPSRPTVLKSTVQARIIAVGKMDEAYAMLTANPVYFARWFAPDHPVVNCDDPDAVDLVNSLNLDPAEILAP